MTTQPPGRKPNKHYRSREYLTPSEVRSLLDAALNRKARYAHRDYTLMLMMFRHGLRVGEAVGSKCGLRWDAVMWGECQIFITREKGSDSGVHPLRNDELTLLKELREQFPDSKYIFVSERGEVMSTDAVRKLIQRLAAQARLDIKVHCHMMRHACGYYLVNQGYSTREMCIRDRYELMGQLGEGKLKTSLQLIENQKQAGEKRQAATAQLQRTRQELLASVGIKRQKDAEYIRYGHLKSDK